MAEERMTGPSLPTALEPVLKIAEKSSRIAGAPWLPNEKRQAHQAEGVWER